MQNNQNSNNKLNTYLISGNQLRKEGKLNQAIDQYQRVLQINQDSIQALSHLAAIHESQKHFDQAFKYRHRIAQLLPKNANAQANLASLMIKQGKVEEAIATYQKAITLSSPPEFAYQGLGNALEKNGQLEEAIANYQKVIDLNPNLPFHVYMRLAGMLKRQGREKEAKNLIKSAPMPNNGDIYLRIWNGLNQISLESLDEESKYFVAKIDRQTVYQYFEQTSDYKVINLTSLSQEDKQFIENVGLSLTYLETYFKLNGYRYNGIIRSRMYKQDFQIRMVEQGSISVLCPVTGKIIHSNRSLFLGTKYGYYNFGSYRFVGDEVFYLICSGVLGEGNSLYFPNHELVIHLSALGDYHPNSERINAWKAQLVTNWEKVKSYITITGVPKIATFIANPQLGHHLLNELSGLLKLYEAGDLGNIDKFFIISNPKNGTEFYGRINDIFPEINSDKIERIDDSQLIEDKILTDNYFIIKLGDNFVTENLVKRIYKISSKKCSPDFLAKTKEAEEKHFPLFWVNIRSHNRSWASQIQGTANLIKSLWKDFPNIGVVIDGFSLPDSWENIDSSRWKAALKEEKEIAKDIQSLLPPEIRVYDIVGCPLHENIIWACAIDLYLAHEGTTQNKVGWIGNKPGVVHGASDILMRKFPEKFRENGIKPVFISKEHIVKIEGIDSELGKGSYDCEPKIIYEEILKLAMSIRTKRVKEYLNTGNKYQQEGKFAEAIKKYSQVLKFDPNLVPALFQLAEIYKNKKQFDREIIYRQRIVKVEPENSHFLRQLVTAYLKKISEKNNIDEAISAYQEVLNLPTFKNRKTNLLELERVYLDLGEVLLQLSTRQGKFDQVVNFFRQAIEKSPNNPWYHYSLGRILAKQANIDEAVAYYKNAIEIKPEFAQCLFDLGILMRKKGSLDEAFECFLKTIQINPTQKDAYSLLSPRSPEQRKTAKEILQTAFEKVEPSHKFFPQLSVAIGRKMEQQGEIEEAIAFYQRSIYAQLKISKPEFVNQYWDSEKLTLQKPNFLLLAVAKCGTTALYDYMVQHPQILSAITKEPWYLNTLIPKLKKINKHQDWSLLDSEKQFYLAHFPPRLQKTTFISGEASTGNIWQGIEQIVFNWFPNIKLIVILRNPIKRAISHYNFRLALEKRSLEEAINSELDVLEEITEPNQIIERFNARGFDDYITPGLYVNLLERWMKLFPREQFLILNNEDLATDPDTVMKQVFEFLGLPEHKFIKYIPKNVGRYSQVINEGLLSRLSDFYRPHNQKLEELLGKNFNW
ncbi:MAG: tetratricopeptide repeat protein [Microcoleaceae cyanobacterium]